MKESADDKYDVALTERMFFQWTKQYYFSPQFYTFLQPLQAANAASENRINFPHIFTTCTSHYCSEGEEHSFSPHFLQPVQDTTAASENSIVFRHIFYNLYKPLQQRPRTA